MNPAEALEKYSSTLETLILLLNNAKVRLEDFPGISLSCDKLSQLIDAEIDRVDEKIDEFNGNLF